MKKTLLLVCLSCFYIYSTAQTQYPYRYLSLSIGQGYEDGIVHNSDIPTFGLGYGKRWNKYLGFQSRVYSHNDVGSDFVNGITTDTENEVTGIKRLDRYVSNKSIIIPWVNAIDFSPINIKRHRLGILAGLAVAYQRYQWAQDIYILTYLKTDKEEFAETLTIGQQTEFSSFVFGEYLGLFYEYTHDRFAFSLNICESNILLGFTPDKITWDLTLQFKYILNE